MNAQTVRSFLLVYIVSLICCAASPSTNDWVKADEGSFTFEIPKQLHKQDVHPVDSHCGKYSSPQMQFDFDEVGFGAGYTTKEARALHNELQKAAGKQKEPPVGSQFVLKLRKRYARVTVGSDEKWVRYGYPGKYAVEFICPDPKGSCLSVRITYKDEKDTETALRIVKSVQVK